MYIIEKEFSFEYAHRLVLPYDSPCTNVHGHSAKVVVAITSEKINKSGMILDFSDLKNIINSIIDKFDHSIIIWKDDPFIDNFKLNPIYFGCINIIDSNPTSENLSRIIAFELYNILKSKEFGEVYPDIDCKTITQIAITFFETAKNSAKYILDI